MSAIFHVYNHRKIVATYKYEDISSIEYSSGGTVHARHFNGKTIGWIQDCSTDDFKLTQESFEVAKRDMAAQIIAAKGGFAETFLISRDIYMEMIKEIEKDRKKKGEELNKSSTNNDKSQ
jgi:hypothetical protein